MSDTNIKGVIFLSHASPDKDVVDAVRSGLNRATTFYDINTIEPGTQTIEAMKSAVSSAAVFVLFHSDSTKSAWVDFEKSLAEIQAIIHLSAKILVCPLKGSDYRSLPTWMQRYMTTTKDFKINDIIRSIQHLYQQSLNQAYPEYVRAFPGRESTKRDITMALMRAPAETGKVVNALVLTGLQGMGRGTLASELVVEAYPGMRRAGPIFEIPAAGDAVDWHLQFLDDLDGTVKDIPEQILAFNSLEPARQASTLLASLRHWGILNQVVTIRHRWGLRDRGNSIRPWLSELFKQLESEPTVRLILISERQLPLNDLARYENVKQFALEELDALTIQFILSQRIEPRFLDAQRLPEIANRIQGHPATANHTAYLVNGGRSLESLVVAPDAVLAFQDKVLAELFDEDVLTDLQKRVLKLLCWFPHLPISIIAEVFPETDRKKIVEDIWQLVEFSLLDQAEKGKYRAPAVVSSTYRRKSLEHDAEVFQRVSRILINQFDAGILDFDLIDSLLIAVVASGEEVSAALERALTPARLEPVVEKEYYDGISAVGKDTQVHFTRCNSLAQLALKMKSSDDTLENILFFGADASVRSGNLPDDILDVMQRKGFVSASYIQASYLFHVKRDFEKAAQILSRTLAASRFKVRNVRLLTRIYLRDGKFPQALDTLGKLTEGRLLRDTGLVMMKVKALRGMRNRSDADALLSSLRNRSDEFGDYSIYQASLALRNGRYSDALKHVEEASRAPRVNRAILSFLKCACEVESGNNESLPETCALARSMNRDSDALQLQARAAIAAKDWRSAEQYISQVKRKDWFDLNVEARMLDIKLADPDTDRDPVAKASASARKEELLRLSLDAVEGSSYA